MACGQWLRADSQPDGRRGDGGNLALASVAVDSLAERQARRWPQSHSRNGARLHARGTDEGEESSCRRHRAVRSGSNDLRSNVDIGYVRGILDIAALRRDL